MVMKNDGCTVKTKHTPAFRQDNTRGYTDAELDAANREFDLRGGHGLDDDDRSRLCGQILHDIDRGICAAGDDGRRA
jgi:hypothetical protein